MDVRPIETRYAGCRFRSRLEARWAVVFDHLGIQWQYEPQGFQIPGGGRYLPDFWLPTLALWVEVKGRFASGEWDKLVRAVDRGLPGDPLSPEVRYPRLLVLGEIPQDPNRAAVHSVIWKRPERVEVGEIVLGEDVFFDFGWRYPVAEVTDPDDLLQARYILATAGKAYEAGRSARFEHGEAG